MHVRTRLDLIFTIAHTPWTSLCIEADSLALDAARGILYVLVETANPVVYAGSWGSRQFLTVTDTAGADNNDKPLVFALSMSDGAPIWGAFPVSDLDSYDAYNVAVAPNSGKIILSSKLSSDAHWYTNPLNAVYAYPPLGFQELDWGQGFVMQITVRFGLD